MEILSVHVKLNIWLFEELVNVEVLDPNAYLILRLTKMGSKERNYQLLLLFQHGTYRCKMPNKDE